MAQISCQMRLMLSVFLKRVPLTGRPRRIFPVSRPQPSGLHTTAPTFWSSASGISSHS